MAIDSDFRAALLTSSETNAQRPASRRMDIVPAPADPKLSRKERCFQCFKSACGGMRSRAGKTYTAAKRVLNSNLGACGMMAVGAAGIVHGHYSGEFEAKYYSSVALVSLGFQTLCMFRHPEGTAETMRHLARRVLRHENVVMAPQENPLVRRKVHCCAAFLNISTGAVLIVQRDLGHVLNRLVVSLDTVDEVAFYSLGVAIFSMYVRMKMERAVEGLEEEEIERMKTYYERCQFEWSQESRRARVYQMVGLLFLNILIIGVGVTPLCIQDQLKKRVDETSLRVLTDMGIAFAGTPLGFYCLQKLDKWFISAHNSNQRCKAKITDLFKFFLENSALPIGLGFFLYKSGNPLAKNLISLILWGMSVGANHRLLWRTYNLKLFDLNNKERLNCGWRFYNFSVYVLPWIGLGYFAYQDAKAPITEKRMPYQGVIGISILATAYFTLCLFRYCVSRAKKNEQNCLSGRRIIMGFDLLQLGVIVLSLYVKFFVPKENKITPMGIIDLAAVWSSVAVSLSNATVGAFFKHTPGMLNAKALTHLPIL